MTILRQFRPGRTTRGALVAAMFLASSLVAPPLAMAQESSTPQEATSMMNERWPEAWATFDEQVEKQTFEAASETAARILAEARAAGDPATATRALVASVQLRLALHGPERAVALLAEEPWPDHPQAGRILPLMRATALDHYLSRYAWQIRQRDERLDAGDDLSLWTAPQLRHEIQTVYAALWAERETWGAEPLGDLGPYVIQNDYPPRIRSTLRDTMTYFWLGHLANRSWWSPEHLDATFRLDLDQLLADAELFTGDPAVATHPLIRIRGILADLEAWHRAGDRPEAAFEARRRLIQELGQSFTQLDEKARLRADLERRLDELGNLYPWWSMGMADLAESLRSQDADVAPEGWIRALEVARAGLSRHPESVGARQCRQIVEMIERPRYSFRGMAIDGPDRRSIGLVHANLDRIWLRAHAVDVAERLRAGQPPLPQRTRARGASWQIIDSPPVAEWQVDLPVPGDYRDHRTEIVPPLGPGAYVITASARGDFSKEQNQTISLGVQIGDPVPIYRPREDGGLDLTVRSGRHGHVIEGAEVEIYANSQAGEPLTRLRTDGEGRASWSPPKRGPGEHRFNGRWHLLIRHDGEQVVDDRWAQHHQPTGVPEHDLVLVYTDRSVYRPKQDVLWKVVAYRRVLDDDGVVERYEAKADAVVDVSLTDGNGQSVVQESVTTGEYGSAAGRFVVPAGRALGSWSLRANDDGVAWIRVEEYKRPTFEVAFLDPSQPLRFNREAELFGEARYYFGLPVTEGTVRWRVERVPVWPRWWSWFRPSVGSRTIATGEAELDADGRFRVDFVAEADERLAADEDRANPWRDVSYRYRISADVTSEGGETRSAERSVRLGFVAVDATVDGKQRFARAGEAARFAVRRTTLDGQPVAGSGQWRIHRLVQPDVAPLPADLPPALRPVWAAPTAADPYATEGDRRAPRWHERYEPQSILGTWPDGATVVSGSLEHDADGNAELTTTLDAGAYRLYYRTEDAFGGVAERVLEFLVTGEEPLRLPALLEVEKASVEVGEVAHLLVHSGLADQDALLEIARHGRVIERRALRFEGTEAAPRIVDLPITAALRGGVALRLVLVRDHQLLTRDVKLDVPWSDRRLDIELGAFRDHLRPGQDETWSVTVRRADGEPVGAEAAEVLAYMFDRGLDLFAEHEPPSIDRLYPRHSWSPTLESAFGRAPQLDHWGNAWGDVYRAPRLTGDRLNLFSPWSIGGPGTRHRPMTMRMAKTAAGNTALMAEETMEVVESAPMLDERSVSAAQAVTSTADATPPPAPPPPPPPPEEAEPGAVREHFAETAFWFPSLLTDADGAVRFEFTVPDSVTEWHVWVHALTRDLRGGRLHRTARTSKELLVRPQLPRFLREGDRAVLRVVVDNTGESPLDGHLSLDLRDPETAEDLSAAFGIDPATLDEVAFAVGPRDSTTLRFPLVAPRRPGAASLTVRGRAGEWSDGERRPLPVLPSRLHLSRSRFAMLRGDEAGDGATARRVLDFGVEDPVAADPTLEHDAFVVTLDAQLFNTVLHALPYLVEYPYECAEQTVNRFLATGLLTRLFDDHPSIERLAAQLAEGREERLERWDPDDPNRRLLLEETPWLRQARGGPDIGRDEALIKVLDPTIAREHRAATLAKLAEMQTPAGGFPWWPGGRPSVYMTLYVLDGFARALEAGVEVPKPMVVKAWSYVAREMRERWQREPESAFRRLAYLSWILSSYPDDSWTGGVFSEDDRRSLLDGAFEYWQRSSPRIKLYLALALHRAERIDDARMLLASVFDSAITDPDLGTYWQPERLSWLWYNDTTETHAFALRTLVEVDGNDPRTHGLAQWLLLQKKLSHWKSTRATAEALYALAAYLEHVDGFGRQQTVRLDIAGDEQRFVFEPDEPQPRRRVVLDGDAAVAPVFTEGEGRVAVASDDPGFVIATATWHFSTEQLPEASDGDLFAVERAFFRRVPTDGGHRLEPLADGEPVAVGDEVEVQLTLTARHAAEYVHLRDPRGAGFEPAVVVSGHEWRDGLAVYREVRDSGTNFFVEWLPAGEVVLRHRLRATMDGTFRVGPATVQGMYAPEFTAHSSGVELTVGE